MIPENELKEITQSHGVPSSTIERDYAQHWLLAYLPQMALKGGTRLNGPRSLKPRHLPDFHYNKEVALLGLFFSKDTSGQSDVISLRICKEH